MSQSLWNVREERMAVINPKGHNSMCSVICSKSILASAHVSKVKDIFQMVGWHLDHREFFLKHLKIIPIQ